MAKQEYTFKRSLSLAPPLGNTDPPNAKIVDPSKTTPNPVRHRRQRDLEIKTEGTQETEQRRSLAQALEFLDHVKVENSQSNRTKKKITS